MPNPLCPQLKQSFEELKNLQSEFKQAFQAGILSRDFNHAKDLRKEWKEKMEEIKEIFNSREFNLKKLIKIEEKINQKKELETKDLKFLYLKALKVLFNSDEKERIREITNNRKDIKADIAKATGYSQDQISLTKEEALSGNSKYHYGYLDLYNLKSAQGLKLPDIVNGDLYLNGLTSAQGLKLPDILNGNLIFRSLTSAQGLKMPDIVNGGLCLRSLIFFNLIKTRNFF